MSALVWLSYSSLLVLGLLDNVRGPFFPEILSELQLNGSAGSLFFAVTSMMAFLGSWSCQFILKKRDSMFLMWVAGFNFAVGYIAIALSHDFFIVLAACALFGLAFGIWNVGQNLLIVEGCAPEFRRRAFNGLHSMYGLAALLAPIVASGFRWVGFDWRQSFLALSVFPLWLGIWSFAWRDKTRAHSEESPAQPFTPAERRLGWVLALILAGYLWGELSVTTRFVLWLRTDLGFSPDRANFYQSAFFAGLLGGRLILSFVPLKGISNWSLMILSSGVSALLLYLGLLSSPLWILLSGFTMSPFFPVLMDQINLMFGKKSAQALGVVIGSGSLSVVVMHVVIGGVTDWMGLTLALKICAFVQLASCAGVLWLKQQNPRHQNETPH